MLKDSTKAKQAFKSASYSASLISPHTSGMPTSATPLPPSRDINSAAHWASWHQRKREGKAEYRLALLLTTSFSLPDSGWRYKLQYFGYLVWRVDSLEKTLMLGKTEEKRVTEYEIVAWHHWLNGANCSNGVWANSRRHWSTGKPGMLQSTGSQKSQMWESDWTTETLPTHWDFLIWRRGVGSLPYTRLPCSVSLTSACSGGSPYHWITLILPGHNTLGKLPASAGSRIEISFLLSLTANTPTMDGNTSCFSWLKTEGQLPPDPVSTQDKSITGFCKAGWRINLTFCFSETMRKGAVVLLMFE